MATIPEFGCFIANNPAVNQLGLAKRRGVLPSRMVILIDELVAKGLVERKRARQIAAIPNLLWRQKAAER